MHSHILSYCTVFLPYYPTVAAGVNAEPIVDYTGGVIYNSKWYNMMVNHVSSVQFSPNRWISPGSKIETIYLLFDDDDVSDMLMYLVHCISHDPVFLFPYDCTLICCFRWFRLSDGEPTPKRTSSIGLLGIRGDNVSRLVFVCCCCCRR